MVAAAAVAGGALGRLFGVGRVEAGHAPGDTALHLGQDNVNGTTTSTRLSGSGGGTDGALKVTNSAGRAIHGTGATGYDGIVGESPNATGVSGTSSSSFGVQGTSTSGVGVQGASNGNVGVAGGSIANFGMYGTSGGQFGVGGAGLVGGVLGTSASGIGVWGLTTGTGTAARFDGTVIVEGDLLVNGQTPKSAVVPHPDGTGRRLYCMESPESWFEDFGQATLSAGRAMVALDPDFAAVVKTDGYHVFLTPRGDCKGLYVAGQTAGGFDVRELQGGSSSVGFAYRVVARRRDLNRARLEKVIVPPRPPLPPGVGVPATPSVVPSPSQTSVSATATSSPAPSTAQPATPQPVAPGSPVPTSPTPTATSPSAATPSPTAPGSTRTPATPPTTGPTASPTRQS
jgi:hypothetical protein